MSERRYTDPALYLMLPVWLCAAIVFPLQLGISGASLLSLMAYLAAAGTLLTLADALHDPDSYRNWQVAAFECALRVLGLAVPAALAFAFGLLAAPAEAGFEYGGCNDAGFSASPATFNEELSDALHTAGADCL